MVDKRGFVCILIGLLTSGGIWQPAAKGQQAISASADIWPQWRGPNRTGQLTPRDWPNRLSGEALQSTWRVPLGPSYSGPIVSESMVFTTETKDEKYEVVRALDRKTGQQIWETSWEGAMSVPFFAKANGDWIRSTPAFDGECLYVAGMRDVLICLDAKDGKTRWQVDFVKQFSTPLPDFGFVCSPLVDGPFVYVQAAGGLCKLDKQTGKVIWRTMDNGGGMWGSAFSSPIFAEVAGRRQLLVQTRTMLAGVDAETGTVLWSQEIPAFRGMNIVTPTAIGDTVFTSAYGAKSYLFSIASTAGAKLAANQAWINPARGYMSSPVVIDGHVYLHLQNRRFTCIDLASGESCWTTKPFGSYWSLVASGDKILALDDRGELFLIKASPIAFELLDQRKVSDEPTWAHLAVCGDELFIRELHALAAYRWKMPGDANASEEKPRNE